MAVAAILTTMGFLAVMLAFPTITRQRGGKVLAFFPLFLLPVVVGSLGSREHIERSKQTDFCLSCHVMSEHGRSLYIDDPAFLAASHFQNKRVPPEQACYTCHTDYTIYGDLEAKWRGLRHVSVNYSGNIPQPSEIKLYRAYNNRECLYCHEGARTFEEGLIHNADPALMPAIKSNTLSCLSSGCHEQVHEVGTLQNQQFWEPGQQ